MVNDDSGEGGDASRPTMEGGGMRMGGALPHMASSSLETRPPHTCAFDVFQESEAESGRRQPLLNPHPALLDSRANANNIEEVKLRWMHRSIEWMYRRRAAVAFTLSTAIACTVLCAHDPVDMFTWRSWFALEVSLIVLMLLVMDQAADLVLLGATLTLLLAGVISDQQAWSGFGSHGVLAIGVLFAVAKALEEAGTVETLVSVVLGTPSTAMMATLQLCIPVVLVSAFVNDTPVVAMMMPVVERWCARAMLPPSRLLIPLSYSAMLGGTVTIIGTSTNLIVQDMIIRDADAGKDPGFRLGFFTTTPVALPCAISGVVLMALLSQALLPEGGGKEGEEGGRSERCYTLDFEVTHRGAGKTLEGIGVMGTRGCRVVHREANIINIEVNPVLELGQVITASCTPEATAALRRMGFLKVIPVGRGCHAVLSAGGGRRRRCLVEAVVSATSPLVGTRPSEADTLTPYGAGIVGIRRCALFEGTSSGSSVDSAVRDGFMRRPSRGAQLSGDAISSIHSGDTLLMEAHNTFVGDAGSSHHFSLVTCVEDSAPPRIEARKDGVRMVGAGVIFAACVALIACDVLSMLAAALIAAYLLIWIQCVTVEQAFKSIKGRVVLSCVAAYGLGEGLSNTHVTDAVALGMVSLGSLLGPIGVLFLVYLATACLSCIVSNQATAIILYSIARNIAAPDVPLKQLVVVIIMGASSSFMTPFGYQTNLMVWKPGGYAFTDFTRIGVPLTLLTGLLASLLTRAFIVG